MLYPVYKLNQIRFQKSVCCSNLDMFSLFLLLIGLAASSASPVLLDERAIGGRILNGRDGNIEEVPWQVALQLDGTRDCGGSIISDFWVLSAAHCIHASVSRYSVRIGSSLPTSGGAVHAIELIINHPSYGRPTIFSNDINLLKVINPFVFSAFVQPIPLASESTVITPGTLGTISGFGLLWWQGPFPDVLQIAQIPIISMEQCRLNHGPSQITDDMLCAGFPEGGIGVCSSDSGGPMVADNLLVGVVNWGVSCGALANRPSVFANVAYFREWIKQNSGV